MNLHPFLPSRCLHCGRPNPEGPLCRGCEARFQPLAEASGPGFCRVCGQRLLAESDVCTDCSRHPWSFPALEGLFAYQEPGGELLRLYKAHGQTRLVRGWARALAARIDPPGPLVPVPPLRRHLWKRGWDPVRVLTQALAAEVHQPVWHLLHRGASAAQKSLGLEQRWSNAGGAYRLGSRRPMEKPDTLWLVDDVVTTGATVEACAHLLRGAGAREVRVLCLGLH